MDPLSASFKSRRVAALLSLTVGIALLAGKWVAYWLSGSHAILSDALESIVNVAASAFALLSVILSARPPDPKYPYGYGKIAYFSAGFEGGLIALAACAILYESIQGLLYGERLQKLDVGVLILLVTSVANGILGLWLVRLGRRTRSVILVADGRHVLADATTSVAVVLGVSLIFLTGWEWIDTAVALLVGLHVLYIGYGLVREAVSGLMDRADAQVLAKIVATLQQARQPGWIDLHQLRAWQAGEVIHIDFHLVVPANWTVAQVHDAHVECQELLWDALGPATEVIIHFDPDQPATAQRPAERPWTVESAMRVPGAGELGSESRLGSPADALV